MYTGRYLLGSKVGKFLWRFLGSLNKLGKYLGEGTSQGEQLKLLPS
jgi:hypothetical protein